MMGGFMSRTKKAWINGILLIITLIINTLGAIGLINGLSQKQVSDMYPTLITPAPFTFSIWSVIYSLLLISIIVMIAKKDDPYYKNAVDSISVLFWISCVLNILWIVAFSFVLIELSAMFIFAFVIVLALICQKLLQIQTGKRWLLPLTFGLYTGWLIIATVVNIATALVKAKWNGFGISPEVWAIFIIIIAIALVLFILLKTRNAVLPLPIAWAYLGIYQAIKSQNVAELNLLLAILLIGIFALLASSVLRLISNHLSVLPNSG